ncbi:MAG: YchJ family protein [Gammaproteobacteria bacterium]|jgi:SEC-C motif-containing protein
MNGICPCEQGELRSERGQPGLSGKSFTKCCEPYLNGSAIAKTPKQLMRSRYTAYALGGYGEYLLSTWLPEMTQGLAAESLSEKTLDWIKLEILDNSQKGDAGIVEFKAYYKDESGLEKVHHEKSTFKRMNRQWYYVEGDVKIETMP